MGYLQKEGLDPTPTPLRLFWVATPLTSFTPKPRSCQKSEPLRSEPQDNSCWFSGKPSLTMAIPPCLVPLGHLWVGHRGLQPLQFKFTLLLKLLFLVDQETFALYEVLRLRP